MESVGTWVEIQTSATDPDPHILRAACLALWGEPPRGPRGLMPCRGGGWLCEIPVTEHRYVLAKAETAEEALQLANEMAARSRLAR